MPWHLRRQYVVSKQCRLRDRPRGDSREPEDFLRARRPRHQCVNTLGASSPSGVASTGCELDVNNVSGTARNYSNLGAPSYGLQVTGNSTSVNTAAILLSGNPGSPQWTAGIVFNNFRSGQVANFGIDFGFDASNTVANSFIHTPTNTTPTSISLSRP
jgi:hypothetical protein